MKPAEFVETLLNDETVAPGTVTLKRVMKELKISDEVILMGGGRVNHSNHKDHTRARSSDHLISSCHTDFVQHKDSC
jgi:hypothetical protein